MLLHPNTWIRFGKAENERVATNIGLLGVVAVMAAIANQVGTADVFSNLIPILRPYLVSDIIEVTEANILESLKSPVSSDQPLLATLYSPANSDLQVSREAFDNTVASMKYEEDATPTTPPTPTIEHLAPSRSPPGKITLSSPSSSSLDRLFTAGRTDAPSEDPFDTSFHMHLTKQNISYKEKEKLTLMRNYLKTLS